MIYEIIENNNEKILKKYLGHFKDLTLPDDITIIDRQAFHKCTFLEHITMGKNLKIIETEAFNGCYGLKTITFNNKLEEIRSRAFWACSSIKEVSFPNSLKVIGSRAFECCTSLTNIHFSNNALLIDEYAFNETRYWYNALELAKKSLKDPNIITLSLPEGITNIDLWAYSNTNIQKVYLPNSLRTIGACAFKNCKQLVEVSISANTICNSQMIYQEGIFSGCINLKRLFIRGKIKDYHQTLLYGFDREKTFLHCYSFKEIIAYDITLNQIPIQWQSYAINAYLSDKDRKEHYQIDVIQSYDHKLLSNPKQLIQMTLNKNETALYQYLIENNIITKDSFDNLLSHAISNENIEAVNMLLHYKKTHLSNDLNEMLNQL